MRVLALEADYPRPDKKYAEGYEGYTWLRLQHIRYNFYKERYLYGDDDGFSEVGEDVGMQELWRAAQGSRHRAFVSCDPVKAQK